MTPDGPAISPLPQPEYYVKAGVVVSRPPIITPDLHPFEKAYMLYQRRLNERLVLPFTQYFYYKRGTPSFEHWRTKRRQRGGVAARDIGNYNAYTKESWNDEVLVDNKDGDPETIVKTLVDEEGRATEFVTEGGDASMAGLRRMTEADEKKDRRSLERALSRTLYLLIKSKPDPNAKRPSMWSFPSAMVQDREGVKECAQRALVSTCGVNMNTWFVGGHPIGHCVFQYHIPKDSQDQESKATAATSMLGEKTFFMKARIMAGQADVNGNTMEGEDFRWLAKDEVQKYVTPWYWSNIRNMLVDQ